MFLVTLKRPAIVTLLAGMQWAGAIFWTLLVAVVVVAVQERALPPETLPVAAFIGAIAVVLQVVCGIGLWNLRPWGRIMQLALAGVGLLFFPIGTFVAVLIFIYLLQPGASLLFGGKSADALTPAEAATLTKLIQPSKVRRLIVVGAIGVVAFAWLTVAAAIAIPALLQARVALNERRAIDALSSLAEAQAEYAAGCGRGGYAASFDVLDATLPDVTMPGSAGYASSVRAVGGYWLSLRQSAGSAAGPFDCRGVRTVTGWYAAATPQTYRASGTRSFATSDAGDMWQTSAADPPAEPFGPPATRMRSKSGR
jgi:hypothetical protein